MTRRTAVFSALAAAVAKATAQNSEPKQRPSPHETISTEAGTSKITISYGRPFLKGRHMGDAMAPFNQVWRLGADEATKITVSGPVAFEKGPKLAAGSYALFAIPGADHWTMIVNKTADQWGAFNYDQAQDLGRFDLPVKQLSAPVEEFTISAEKQGKSARLTFAWDKQSVSAVLSAG